MYQVVVSLIIFVGLGAFFLFFHLLMGTLVRPLQGPKSQRQGSEDEKLTIYECGEPTIGSAWVQFDLRYYVVALLFVIFDVEVAFFFPWATVFGKANTLALTSTPVEERKALTSDLGVTALPPISAQEKADFKRYDSEGLDAGTASSLAWVGFADIMVFFGVLMVGFAYLWKRGDINWVRSVLGEQTPGPLPETITRSPELVAAKQEPVGAAH